MSAYMDDSEDSASSCESPDCMEDGEPRDNESLPLTFGIEIECQVVLRGSNKPENKRHLQEQVKAEITDLLCSSGVPANNWDEEEAFITRHEAPVRADAGDTDFPGHKTVKRKYQKWQVKEEEKNAPFTEPEYRRFVPVELASCTFYDNDEAYDEISTVCEVLRRNYNLTLFQCGLHVHVSARPLSLLQQKRLVTLVWVSEDIIYRLCSPGRDSKREVLPIRLYSDANRSTSLARPYVLHDADRTAEEMRENLPGSLPQSEMTNLTTIWDATSLKELQRRLWKEQGMSGDDRNALNIKPPTRGKKIGTFEAGRLVIYLSIAPLVSPN